jgi:acetyl esterase/lipase
LGVGATVAYRLAPKVIWPAQIHDCKAAIRWLRANAKKYDFDPERIGVWGVSAGGHLVSLLGTTTDRKSGRQAARPARQPRLLRGRCLRPTDLPNLHGRRSTR